MHYAYSDSILVKSQKTCAPVVQMYKHNITGSHEKMIKSMLG